VSLVFVVKTTNNDPHKHNVLTLPNGGKETQLTWLPPLSAAFQAHLMFATILSFSSHENLATFVF